MQHLRHVALLPQRRVGLEQQVVEQHRLAEVEQRPAHGYFFCSSSRSVAGGGVRESAAIRARCSGARRIFTESSEERRGSPYPSSYILLVDRRPVPRSAYLPESSPPPAGLYGTTPMPFACAIGRISTSAWRFTRL